MASTKSLEDMLLSSDIDEQAVSALVGSLESQLSSSDAHYTRTELSSATVNNNHIGNASVADCNARMPDGQKHGALLGSLLEQGTTNKNLTNPQIMGLSSQNLSNAVIVSLPGALPASGYISQVSSTNQALMNSSAVGRHVSNSDIKLVYSPQSTSSPFSSASSVVTSGVITTNQINRNNFKVAALHNGNSNFNNIVAVTSGGGPVLQPPTSGATLNAMQNLANIASQQPRIQVISQHQQQINNALNTKSVSPRGQVDNKSKQNSPQVYNNIPVDHRQSPSNQYQVQASVITSKPSQSVNVVTQVVTNPNMLPPGVQLLSVNPARLNQKTLAPRGIVVGNQVRIAPQMLRQGTPIQVPGQGAIALPASMRGAIVVRADGSQYHVFNVATPPNLQAGSSTSPSPTYRLQSLPPGVPGIIRTLSPQQVVSVPVSSASVKTLSSAPGSVVRTMSPQVTVAGQTFTKTQAPQTVVSTVLQQTAPTNVVRTPAINTTTSSVAMSPNTIKKKCQNFLSTLIKLAGDQTTKTASNVKKLIQNLIDGTIEPEEFSTQLQKELRSSPQPYLNHFLKKSLPHVRQSLISKEMTIDGIRPPLPPPSMQTISATPPQVTSIRTTFAPSARMSATTIAGSALTAQLNQPPGSTLLTQRLISPQVPHGLPRAIRPLPGVTTGYGGLVESSPATVGALQSKIVLPRPASVVKASLASKEKKAFVSVRDEDDINDVAAMGGVNLLEESQRILATNSELIGSQIRSCKDESHLAYSALHRRILAFAKKRGIDEVKSDVVDLIAHAAEERLKTIIEKLSIVSEHRLENPKNDPRFEVSKDVKGQIKFLEELDKLEKKRHDDQEKEILLKAAKSRSKLEDPELLKLKQKAKEMQRAENEELRQREANMTALLAIGPRKKLKTENSTSASTSESGSTEQSSSGMLSQKLPVRPRVKRINLRDLLFVMESDPKTVRRSLLYKYYGR
ncbi:transcription initiation factor TFIID subunit 4-like [Uloborus diversus]|uniref:transcription initiation factor TFIID subunit 4-like n=1 Tax=Uloborus diversus TaxID=327109 RepID=UPI002409B1B0|nr:transcription initiation factor TFIID subunit 4-like [Uloborus diversus]